MSVARDKRPATSPLSEDVDEKRQFVSQDESFKCDADATILNPDFLSSTALDTSIAKNRDTMATGSSKEELRPVLCDPDILAMIGKAVATHVCNTLMSEITALRKQMHSKDNEIMFMEDKIDDLEQYTRRNSIRINRVPEFKGENTDDIIKSVAKTIDVELTDDMVDRSHRVDPKSTTDHRNRAIVVKFTSYRCK